MEKKKYSIENLDDANRYLSSDMLRHLCAGHSSYASLASVAPGGIYHCDTIEEQREHWALRECARLLVGDYVNISTLAPTVSERMCAFLGTPHIYTYYPEHFLHVSTDRPGMVAYTPDTRYGEQDRQVRTSFAKYLTRWYSELLTNEQINELSREFTDATTPVIHHITTDPALIEHVYENGPPSCMRRDRGHLSAYALPHPVQCYGSVPGWEADTALAFSMQKDKYVARGIINRKTQTYGRLYDHNGLTRDALAHWLQDQGYTKENDWLNNAKIRALYTANGDLLAPYLDCVSRADLVSTPNAFWHITFDGEYELFEPSGLPTQSQGEYFCDVCEEYGHEDTTFSEFHNQNICNDCLDAYQVVYVDINTTDWIAYDHEDVVNFRGRSYLLDALVYFDLILCEDDEIVSTDEAIETDTGFFFSCPEAAEDAGYRLCTDGDWIHEVNAVITFEGETYRESACYPLFDNSYSPNTYPSFAIEQGEVAYSPTSGFSHTLVFDTQKGVCFAPPEPYVTQSHEVLITTPDEFKAMASLEAA